MKIDIHIEDSRGNVFTLLEPLYCEGVTVPAGFESDGASVPRFFWRVVFPPGDRRAIRAAFFHDYVYRTHPVGWTRTMADKAFFRVLLADGVGRFRARIAYLGVRWGGICSWLHL